MHLHSTFHLLDLRYSRVPVWKYCPGAEESSPEPLHGAPAPARPRHRGDRVHIVVRTLPTGTVEHQLLLRALQYSVRFSDLRARRTPDRHYLGTDPALSTRVGARALLRGRGRVELAPTVEYRKGRGEAHFYHTRRISRH